MFITPHGKLQLYPFSPVLIVLHLSPRHIWQYFDMNHDVGYGRDI